MPQTSDPPTIADLFTCTRCGFCCQGETTVSLDENDQKRMLRVLGLPREVVAKRYWRIRGAVVQMQVRDGHCIFYQQGQGCSIHAGRPWRCRQWPLHPSMLIDKDNYRTIADSCPGLRQDLDHERLRALFSALILEQEQQAKDS